VDCINWKSTNHNKPSTAIIGRDSGAAGNGWEVHHQ
jgi:hypothetical protein